MTRPVRHLLGLALTAAALAGCGTSSDHALRHGHARARDAHADARPASTRVEAGACINPTATPAPAGHHARGGHMPSGSFMATIQHRGYLRAGVNAGALRVRLPEPRHRKYRGVRDRPRPRAGPGHLRRLQSRPSPPGGAERAAARERRSRTAGSTSSSMRSRSPARASSRSTSRPCTTTPTSGCWCRRTRRPPTSPRSTTGRVCATARIDSDRSDQGEISDR